MPMPWLGSILMLVAVGAADEPAFEQQAIFPPERKHNHASCVVESRGGDLFAAWYSGSGERTADDVVIRGAWLRKEKTTWDPTFLLADTPGYPDCNPALFAAPGGALWLFWPTILDHRWEGALLKYAVFEPWPNGPNSVRPGVLHITPSGFDRAMESAVARARTQADERVRPYLDRLTERSKDLLYQRLGWMPRVHPTVLPSGRWLLPLYSDTFSASIIAISDDQGASWKASQPLIGFGNIQPSIVRRNDGTLVAFMRDNGSHKKIKLSQSSDQGETWSDVTDSTLPNPGAGIEAVRLASGAWLLIYNDTTRGRHSLAVSLSDDEGATWKVTRHVANKPGSTESFHYPSIIQAADGWIHITFTHGGLPGGSTIEHARFNEAWVRQGD
jgi:predicted neuraminidase